MLEVLVAFVAIGFLCWAVEGILQKDGYFVARLFAVVFGNFLILYGCAKWDLEPVIDFWSKYGCMFLFALGGYLVFAGFFSSIDGEEKNGI